MNVYYISHNVVELQDTKFTPKLTKPYFIQWLGENVCKLNICTDMINMNVPLFHMISRNNTYINVLGAGMIFGILSNIDGTFIIT